MRINGLKLARELIAAAQSSNCMTVDAGQLVSMIETSDDDEGKYVLLDQDAYDNLYYKANGAN